jgi:hypothetical protein
MGTRPCSLTQPHTPAMTTQNERAFVGLHSQIFAKRTARLAADINQNLLPWSRTQMQTSCQIYEISGFTGDIGAALIKMPARVPVKTYDVHNRIGLMNDRLLKLGREQKIPAEIRLAAKSSNIRYDLFICAQGPTWRSYRQQGKEYILAANVGTGNNLDYIRETFAQIVKKCNVFAIAKLEEEEMEGTVATIHDTEYDRELAVAHSFVRNGANVPSESDPKLKLIERVIANAGGTFVLDLETYWSAYPLDEVIDGTQIADFGMSSPHFRLFSGS